MKKNALIVLAAFLVGIFAGGVALGTDDMRLQQKGAATIGTTQTSVNVLHSGNEFIGAKVHDRNGQEIGEVKDLAIDFDRGIAYAEVSTEEALEMDETFLVPLSALTSSHEGDFVTLNIDRSQLAASPRMEPGMTGDEFGRRTHEFFGVSYPWSDLPGDQPVSREAIPGKNLTYPGPREVVPSEKR